MRAQLEVDVTQNYGVSFAAKLITQGKYEEAIASATHEHERDPADPIPLFDRATAHAALEQHAEAVTDFEHAFRLDEITQSLELDEVDDALFSSLLAEARGMATTNVTAGVARLEHYRTVLPSGRHIPDVGVWAGRLRGEGRDAVIVKEY